MDDMKRSFDSTLESAKEYIDLKAVDLKLKATEGLSVALGRFLSVLIIVIVAMILLSILAFAFILGIGELIGSPAIGALIVAALFAILLAVLYGRREHMFTDSFVKLFSGIFFSGDEEAETNQEETIDQDTRTE